MSPQTAHNCDGLCAIGWAVITPTVEMLRDVIDGSLLFNAMAEAKFVRQLGELDAELDALGIDLRRFSRAAFELSLLDVDSERCNGNDARRC